MENTVFGIQYYYSGQAVDKIGFIFSNPTYMNETKEIIRFILFVVGKPLSNLGSWYFFGVAEIKPVFRHCQNDELDSRYLKLINELEAVQKCQNQARYLPHWECRGAWLCARFSQSVLESAHCNKLILSP
ncbi:MAG: hypothetical protein WCY84_01910 [Candidatus Cloacimonadaceae bacterium]